jgi:spore maturation protein CgeB
MRIVIFGLSVSSAWGNGHATLWRGLIRALDEAGHDVAFFERDTSYYRAHRDVEALPGRAQLHVYEDWNDVRTEAANAVDNADAAIVTSYCFDGRAACELACAGRTKSVFYDLDTPVTLARVAAGEEVPYLPVDGLGAFDLVLSYTGGAALDALRERLGARRVAPLYGSVDPDVHRPMVASPRDRAACSYLGTWCADRQEALDALFLEPARRRASRFVLGGSMYPATVELPWNVTHLEHVSPGMHSAFYCASPITVSVTRKPMVEYGHCPSGRLFEAAACGVPVLSDAWTGLDTFFEPDEEILIASTPEQALDAIELPRDVLRSIGARARERTLDEHTSVHRAQQLVGYLEAS